MSDPLDVIDGGPDDNVQLPLPQILVDASRSFLFGQEVEFKLPEPQAKPGIPAAASAAPKAAQAYLDETWTRNRKMVLLNLVALNGGIAGHTFLAMKTTPGVGGRPDVDLFTWDPADVEVEWDQDDFRIVNAYIHTWTIEERVGNENIQSVRRTTVRANESRTGWTITEEISRGDDKGFRPLPQQPDPWEHPFPPVLDCQNLPAPNSYYGTADLENASLRLIKALNYVASNMNRILRLHAHPKTWVKNATPPVQQPGGNDWPYLNGKRSGQPKLDWNPDEAIFLMGDGEVGQLVPAADMSASLQFFDRMLTLLHQASRVPEIALGVTEGVGPVPGVTLRILYGPLLTMTEDKRRLYGQMLEEACRRILVIGGFGDRDVDLIWPDPLPKDLLSEAQAALALQQAGVSKKTTLTELGYNAEDEATERQADADEAAANLMNAQAAVAPGTEA